MASRNRTGFDPQKFAASSGQPANDPWMRNEAWRYSGPFTRWNRYKRALPGLGIGTGAFILYLAYEAAFTKDSHGHGEGHAKEASH